MVYFGCKIKWSGCEVMWIIGLRLWSVNNGCRMVTKRPIRWIRITQGDKPHPSPVHKHPLTSFSTSFTNFFNYQLSYFCFYWIQVLCPDVGESWDWRGCLIDLICLFATYLSAQASIQRDKSMDMGRDLFSPPNLGEFLLTHSFARICDQNWTQQLKLLLIWKRCTKMLKHGYLWFSR